MKVVIKVSITNQTKRFWCFGPKNSHSKALRLAAGFPGAQSVALEADKGQIKVTGEFDVVNLATLLRKKVGFAEVVSVGKESKDKSSDEKDKQPVVWSYPRQEIVYVRDPYLESPCWPL
ncbi:uncharacterized protein J3R85_008884 [Psidium guajava]|nr:uncharacterized protein J3R85_008884 [Psidium guajava]